MSRVHREQPLKVVDAGWADDADVAAETAPHAPGAYLDLSTFRVPAGFRGRPGWYVQLWWVVQALLFRPSPQLAYGWRRMLLRLFGAKVGEGAIIRPTVRVTYPWKVSIGAHAWVGDDVTLYSLGEIEIGAHSVVSQKSYLCAGDHDYETVDFMIRGRPVRIGSEVWVASDVFVAPGVTIGDGVVVGARSTVLRSLDSGFVYAGNPARAVKRRAVSRVR
ncbi:putative colanic acid biosynthesis acetyltransferase [Pararobbsia silviterrae]|uniref:Colanic acid biosynthesis acetyltransferase WcaF n=1 Tax=Pararobbsia silviterrae TaxID=1792498 RepID=A0A494YFJ8_9BURK|nr:putative colanic acid biosynthesis acetyltransferase [Pararobbsia silviterrae]RKP59133.1 colanic acid biosynthesis acetyltransferase WcaF [Pararobbsia silviterrae]